MRHASLIVILILGMAPLARADAPNGWSPVIVATGSYRSHLQSIPVHQRPGRPLHVYGNTLRMLERSSGLRGARPVRQVIFGTGSLRGSRITRR